MLSASQIGWLSYSLTIKIDLSSNGGIDSLPTQSEEAVRTKVYLAI